MIFGTPQEMLDEQEDFNKSCKKENKEETFSLEDMINASRYGYNFHKTTSFPEHNFDDACIRNTQQWLTTFKKK